MLLTEIKNQSTILIIHYVYSEEECLTIKSFAVFLRSQNIIKHFVGMLRRKKMLLAATYFERKKTHLLHKISPNEKIRVDRTETNRKQLGLKTISIRKPF